MLDFVGTLLDRAETLVRDIDAQRVIRARQLGGAKDAELLHYYNRRRVWLLGKRGGRLFVTPM